MMQPVMGFNTPRRWRRKADRETRATKDGGLGESEIWAVGETRTIASVRRS